MSSHEKIKPGQWCLYIKEQGGCDYTIGCGMVLEPLPHPFTDQDIREVFDNFGLGNFREATEVLLVQVDQDLMDLYNRYRADRRQHQDETAKEAKMAELERLKKELGMP